MYVRNDCIVTNVWDMYVSVHNSYIQHKSWPADMNPIKKIRV